jgi:xanthine dehydrogenase accessory factor
VRAFWKAVYDHLKAGEPVALVTVAASKGSVPRGAGARMAVFADGSSTGSVGGGAVEHAARAFAQETVAGGARLKRYGLTRDDAAGLGMICGGDVTLLFQPLLPGLGAAEAVSEAVCAALAERRPCWLAQEVLPDGRALMGLYGKDGLLAGDRLDPEPALAARPILETGARIRFTDPVSRAGRALIFGGGHVSRALTPILAGVGFSVFVYDDRPEFADIARFPARTARRCGFLRSKARSERYARRLCGHRHPGPSGGLRGAPAGTPRRGRLPWHDWQPREGSGHPGPPLRRWV